MIEENKLRQHVGTKEPFKVPEGYFDTFADRLQARIDQMPQVKKPTKVVNFVPKAWFAAAASVVIVASVGLSIMVPRWKDGKDLSAVAQTELASADVNSSEQDEAYFDELDYAMIDNNEIAYYLTEY